MRRMFLVMLCIASSVSMMGQMRVIKGSVIDKETGNYLPGAEVSVVGGAESTVTDADGTFSLEAGKYVKFLTARYAGMCTQKVGVVDDDILIQMRRKKSGNWFLNLEGGVVFPDYHTDGSIGLMGGYLGKWGGYAKFMMTPWADDFLCQATAGVTKRVFPWMHACFGLGGGLGYEEYYAGGGKWGYWRSDCDPEFLIEAGFVFEISNHFSANINYSCGLIIERTNHNLSLGAGYAF